MTSRMRESREYGSVGGLGGQPPRPTRKEPARPGRLAADINPPGPIRRSLDLPHSAPRIRHHDRPTRSTHAPPGIVPRAAAPARTTIRSRPPGPSTLPDGAPAGPVATANVPTTRTAA